jgi:hypothetical protein
MMVPSSVSSLIRVRPTPAAVQNYLGSEYFWRLTSCAMSLSYGRSSLCWQLPIPAAVHNILGSDSSWKLTPCAMPLLHGVTPSCRRQPTTLEIHNYLGSVLLVAHFALQTYAGRFCIQLVWSTDIFSERSERTRRKHRLQHLFYCRVTYTS